MDWNGDQIRETFLRFFETRDRAHRRVHSSSLVPANDPTLLFTNAGMNQFKDVFLGVEKRDPPRATSSQKCVRAGGKHNDLENVGFTRRHHTFFEMLGNFSFGDYFKREAIAYAWELVTSPEWFDIPKDRLYVTIFEGNDSVPRDDEAEKFWLEVGVPKDRIFAMGAKDNFWQMGETGPCGPCSEIFYDMGLAASESGKDLPFPHDDDRYVEIWNLVFMQFDRVAVPNHDPSGKLLSTSYELRPLPRPCVDTGAGLERLAAVLQDKLSNFETDLFTPLIVRAAELTRAFTKTVEVVQLASALEHASKHLAKPMGQGSTARLVRNASLRIIADHSRAATFLISDGVQPANEGRGYVLRKILRRAIRHGRLLGQDQPFLNQMVYAVRDQMHAAYPELAQSADRVAKVVLAEEKQFARVLEIGAVELDRALNQSLPPTSMGYYKHRGFSDEAAPFLLDVCQKYIATHGFDQLDNHEIRRLLAAIPGGFSPMHCGRIADDLIKQPVGKLNGKTAFSLYETYGLPLDFIEDAARDAGLAFDLAGFEESRKEEQARARSSWKGGSKSSASPAFRELPKTIFEGYNQLVADNCEVLAIVKNNAGVQSLAPGDQADVVLDHTSFYADSGGQIGDTGWLYSADRTTVLADVHGCTKPVAGVFAHKITARQPIALGDYVVAQVDEQSRAAIMRNHTATHLLHAALRSVLGSHVKQAGSLVDPEHLRFDFSHFQQVADEEMQDIEDLANREVLKNTRIDVIEDVPIDVAVNKLHAMALFGEKYGDRVRVIKIGDFSTELCGGTHTSATGEIGLLKLLGENSVSSGVRRVQAVSGTGALHEFRRDYEVARVAEQLAGSARTASDASPAAALRQKLAAQDDELKRLRRELDEARMKSASSSVASSAQSAVEVGGVKVVAQRVAALDRGQMRTLVDNLRTKLGSGIVVLGSASDDGKVALIVGVTKDLTARIAAGKIVAALAPKVGGSGGGRPDLAEAGGKDPSQLDSALAAAPEVVRQLLA